MSGCSPLRLDELLRELPPGSALSGDGAISVRGVHQDSREVSAGDLFVALRGARTAGGEHINAARKRGAVAVLTDLETPVPDDLACVRVSDVRAGLALAAAAVYGHPAFGLDIVGITGTNGKTTTAHLVRAAIDGALGRPTCGVIGTVGHSFGEIRAPAAHTTPEADELARVLAAMKGAGASHVAMEVSSIALAAQRVHAIRFRVAAFTNLTQDHLDYHGTMADYSSAKAELFTSLSPSAAVINVDDPFGRELSTRVRAPLFRVSSHVGAAPHEADVAPETLRVSERGIEARVRVGQDTVALTSPLFGAHNVENLMVAVGVARALDLDVEAAVRALEQERGAPGRLERCERSEDDIVALVDYAHTPDALARVLAAARELSGGRIIAVFGCGGDRDRSKRGPMGRAAATLADVSIVTNDNPRHEVPEVIAARIIEGLASAGARPATPERLAAGDKGYFVELDRARAIELGILAAAPGDVVLVCGKGHEDYQVFGDERLSFDDCVEVRRALGRRREGRGDHGA